MNKKLLFLATVQLIDITSVVAMNEKKPIVYFWECENKNIPCFKYLRDKANAEAAAIEKEIRSFTELENNNITYFQDLLDNADANDKMLILQAKNEDGFSLLHLACAKGYLEIMQILCTHPSIDVNIQSTWFRNAPLHLAASNNKGRIVQDLCKLPQIEVNLPNKCYDTPLHLACYKTSLEITQILCTHPSIDVNIQNYTGQTALYKACSNGSLAIVTYLCTLPQITDTYKLKKGGNNL